MTTFSFLFKVRHEVSIANSFINWNINPSNQFICLTSFSTWIFLRPQLLLHLNEVVHCKCWIITFMWIYHFSPLLNQLLSLLSFYIYTMMSTLKPSLFELGNLLSWPCTKGFSKNYKNKSHKEVNRKTVLFV